MVCAKCEKKLRRVAAPDPSRAKDAPAPASAATASAAKSKSGQSAGKAPRESRVSGRGRLDPLGERRQCRICKAQVHQVRARATVDSLSSLQSSHIHLQCAPPKTRLPRIFARRAHTKKAFARCAAGPC